jgi:hypothetical protein
MTRAEQRPVQHRIGDAAANAVALIWSVTGAAVEHVQQDYGEDLLVQPSVGGRMDPARIWVQVKGTTSERPTPRRLRIRNSQLLRWSRTTDLMVIVNWNARHSMGWYATIEPAGPLVDLVENPQGHSTIAFDRADVFDVHHAEMLVRDAILTHADNELLLRRAWHEQSSVNSDLAEVNPAISSIVLSAMLSIGIVHENPDHAGSYQLTKKFVDEAAQLFSEANSEEIAFNHDEAVADALLQAVLETTLVFARAPLRANLLEMMTRAALHMLRPARGWPMPVPWE